MFGEWYLVECGVVVLVGLSVVFVDFGFGLCFGRLYFSFWGVGFVL